MLPDENAALIQRMAQGDESALDLLYDKWGARVHTVAFCILQDADEAEDVVEETFWQAWRSAAKYDAGRAPGSAWLVMMARSRALDRVRQRRRQTSWLASPATMDALLEGASSNGTELPSARAERSERATALGAALARLAPEQREVLELAFLGGLSHAEVAAHLTQPLGTVKTRIRLAMQKLREQLALLGKEGS